jgi:hypothetical protein
MWRTNRLGEREFTRGTEDWEAAALVAASCSHFTPDEEEELVADAPSSCYNCRYRRWTADTIICCARGLQDT